LNVLLITADQWRADCLGVLAGSGPHPLPARTPALDSFAREAVLFRRHYTQATPCGPSRAALLTGTYSFNNRSIANGTPLDARHLTIAQLARRPRLPAAALRLHRRQHRPAQCPGGRPAAQDL